MNLQSYLIVALISLALGGMGGWGATSNVYRARIAELQQEQTKAMARIDEQNLKVQQKIIADYEGATKRANAAEAKAAEEASVQTKKDSNIKKEVIKYATLVPIGARCALPVSWRMRHDAAATGDDAILSEDSASAGKRNDSSGPVDDASALETIAGNYAECRRWRDQLVGWQRWWGAVNASD